MRKLMTRLKKQIVQRTGSTRDETIDAANPVGVVRVNRWDYGVMTDPAPLPSLWLEVVKILLIGILSVLW